MFHKKIKQMTTNIKQNAVEIIKLLLNFKWYIIFDFVFFLLLMHEYLNPPSVNDPIWNSEAMLGAWNYQNQQLYIQTVHGVPFSPLHS